MSLVFDIEAVELVYAGDSVNAVAETHKVSLITLLEKNERGASRD